MARIRYLKPEFFDDERLCSLKPLARLLFAGMWCWADREGRLRDEPVRLKKNILGYDKGDVNAMLVELEREEFITRYEVDGRRYIQIKQFLRHQKPHYKEPPSTFPSVDGHSGSGIVASAPPESVRQAIFDRDGRKCQECGATDRLSLDHIIPRVMGGTNDEHNLQTLCISCNSKKRNRDAALSSNQLQPTGMGMENGEGNRNGVQEQERQPVPLRYRAVEDLLGTLSKTIIDEIDGWEVSDDWIVEAAREAALNNGRSVKYVGAIITRWKRDGFKAERKSNAAPTRSGQGHPTPAGRSGAVRRTSDFD